MPIQLLYRRVLDQTWERICWNFSDQAVSILELKAGWFLLNLAGLSAKRTTTELRALLTTLKMIEETMKPTKKPMLSWWRGMHAKNGARIRIVIVAAKTSRTLLQNFARLTWIQQNHSFFVDQLLGEISYQGSLGLARRNQSLNQLIGLSWAGHWMPSQN